MALLPGLTISGTSHAARAAPIEYSLTIPNATAHLGTQTYSNATVIFDFFGDDANVISESVPSGILTIPPIEYAANYKGAATVEILSGNAMLANATFLPKQIVATSDEHNGGVGFGYVAGGVGSSFNVGQLQPLYPAGISNYLLLTGQDFPNPPIQTFTYLCYEFGGSIFVGNCANPTFIPTDLGNLSIDIIAEPTTVGKLGTPITIGEFTAKPIVNPRLPIRLLETRF
jgi:hypothetical protein